jgi:hypothetical protein
MCGINGNETGRYLALQLIKMLQSSQKNKRAGEGNLGNQTQTR